MFRSLNIAATGMEAQTLNIDLLLVVVAVRVGLEGHGLLALVGDARAV